MYNCPNAMAVCKTMDSCSPCVRTFVISKGCGKVLFLLKLPLNLVCGMEISQEQSGS